MPKGQTRRISDIELAALFIEEAPPVTSEERGRRGPPLELSIEPALQQDQALVITLLRLLQATFFKEARRHGLDPRWTRLSIIQGAHGNAAADAYYALRERCRSGQVDEDTVKERAARLIQFTIQRQQRSELEP